MGRNDHFNLLKLLIDHPFWIGIFVFSPFILLIIDILVVLWPTKIYKIG